MTQSQTLTSDGAAPSLEQLAGAPTALALVIAWAPGEPGRVGDVCVVPASKSVTLAFTLGRGRARADGDDARLEFARHRPGAFEPRPPLSSARISRRQLVVRVQGEQLAVQNVGRCPLHHNGAPVESAEVAPGDTLRLGGELLLVCVRRPAWLAPVDERLVRAPFGDPDAYGFVGESAAAWQARRQLAFMAARTEHVLVVGESGTGKEIAARSLHELSPRAQMPFCARNAATFPEGIIDSELFGHARNYPNAGMPERPGLLAQAAGGTLFLDELAELPASLQTHLLRVLDDGEYQRLGEAGARVSEARFVGATNRPELLRPDLAARFRLSLRMPGLNERIEDIPLLVLHILRSIARTSADMRARIEPDGAPRVAIRFVDALMRRRYTTHVRELEGLLWKALADRDERANGKDGVLDGRLEELRDEPSSPSRQVPVAKADPRKVSARAIASALAENEGNRERTWRALGLGSRHVLTRLMAKHGLRRPGPASADES